ncbi:flagellar protein FlgN [Paenibacillus sp. GCM10027628]|uniref:flagellar protein FlgN n=1 Tax=Paenibacillus sp. GCM10027628 TaxID=3273413 RepID=UPI00364211D6
MSIQALIDVLYKLNDAHVVLLELGERKKQAIIQNKVDILNQIVNKENKYLVLVTELEQMRLQETGSYLIARGYHPNPQITVSQLVKLIFKAEDKMSLQDAQENLSKTLLKLRELNTLNKQLIEDSLNYIDFSLDLFLGRFDDEPIYSKPTEAQQSITKLNIFDARA